MAGTNVQVDFDTTELVAALNHVLATGRNLRPVMMEIAEHLHRSTRDRFDREEAPDGTPWAPVTPQTQARKNAGYSAGGGQKDKLPAPDKILHGATLLLRDNMAPLYDEDEAGLAALQAYAATHQFGAPERNIPARPFLGLSPGDQAEILDILAEAILPP